MKSRVATLQSIELAGFKSFAKRTKIEFNNGLIAIVGPNGSGKSNITDAIRWVFGEQKGRSLRTDKSEDLIYHGGNGKSRASMAEVVIRLDNSARAIPIELNEIEITRRLYRSGESNYLLNGRRASLSSIQEVLAASGFGVGSYTVIGQGMIDRLILASGKERKQLFEEASGIKQYEIKHTQVLKRIALTQDNLNQISLLISELQPKHESLSRQAELLDKKNSLASRLSISKASYILNKSKDIDQQIASNNQLISLQNSKLRKLNDEIKEIELANKKNSSSNSKYQLEKINSQLSKLDLKKLSVEKRIANTLAVIEKSKLELSDVDQTIENCHKELTALRQNMEDHNVSQRQIEKVVKSYDSKLIKIDEKIKIQNADLDDARKSLISSQKSEYLKHSLGLIDILHDGVKRKKTEQELQIIFYKLRRMIKHSINDNSAEFALKVGKIQNSITRLMDERENISEHQTNEIIKLRAIELDSASLGSKIKETTDKMLKAEKQKDTLLSSSGLSKSKLLLSELELLKDGIDQDIFDKRKELLKSAEIASSDDNDEYYEKHEQLTNLRVSIESELKRLEEEKQKVLDQQNEIHITKNLWFPYKMLKPKKLVKTSLDEINKLEAEVSLLEEINPKVANEILESKKQLTYLKDQSDDLSVALSNLNKVARDTEAKIKSVFQKGFLQINSNFSNNFKELFGGGQAELRIDTKEEDYGVEIFVQLPNKNAQNISSLSGGEKALASVALLSGILMSNPSPFVVLDEVDAALDEENTKRFANIISKITKHSQVLVVTHNHDTMSVADELLGVTTSGNNESSIMRVQLGSFPLEAKK